jgi:hypothetical protein
MGKKVMDSQTKVGTDRNVVKPPLILTVCLESWRSPALFITRHWKAGVAGAFRMGVAQGWLWLGCCWALTGFRSLDNPAWAVVAVAAPPQPQWISRTNQFPARGLRCEEASYGRFVRPIR